MAEPKARAAAPILDVRGLNVYYGRSHALQGVDLTLRAGVMSVVGRNGMGKTTLCKAIMGMVPSSGSIRFDGQEIRGRTSTEIARMGIGYVPQGRRLWRSLTVDEHLRMIAVPGGAWSPERIYSTFPRLGERKSNGGGQLSGGEQQMLAISRALLLNPKLLVMDEPTEGLAPVIVAQVEEMLIRLGEEGQHVLVIEQNIGVATEVAPNVAIMVNGRIDRLLDAGQLAADRELQQRLLGVGRVAHEDTPAPETEAAEAAPRREGPAKLYLSNPAVPTRWSRPVPVRVIEQNARTVSAPSGGTVEAELRPLASPGERIVIVAGTLDTKGAELRYMRDILRGHGLAVRMADLSTSGKHSGAEIPAHQIAAFHPRGASAVFTEDRGRSVAGMTEAFERWMARQSGVAGVIGAGGSGGTAMLAPAMRRLPVGRAEAHRLHRRLGQRAPVCRRVGHHHHALGGGRAGPQRHHPARPRQRGARARRHGRGRRDGDAAGASGGRADHVRRHHALRPADQRERWRRRTTASSSMPPASAGRRWRSWSTAASSRA